MEGSHLWCGNGAVLSTGVGGLLPTTTTTLTHSHTQLHLPHPPPFFLPPPAFGMQLQDGGGGMLVGGWMSATWQRREQEKKKRCMRMDERCSRWMQHESTARPVSVVKLCRADVCLHWSCFTSSLWINMIPVIDNLLQKFLVTTQNQTIHDDVLVSACCPLSPRQLLPDDP